VTQQYKLKFRHYKTGEIIEKIVTKPDFSVQGEKEVFYNLTDNKYEDVIKTTIVEVTEVKPTDDDYIKVPSQLKFYEV
jgi:hypothetical protein